MTAVATLQGKLLAGRRAVHLRAEARALARRALWWQYRTDDLVKKRDQRGGMRSRPNRKSSWTGTFTYKYPRAARRRDEPARRLRTVRRRRCALGMPRAKPGATSRVATRRPPARGPPRAHCWTRGHGNCPERAPPRHRALSRASKAPLLVHEHGPVFAQRHRGRAPGRGRGRRLRHVRVLGAGARVGPESRARGPRVCAAASAPRAKGNIRRDGTWPWRMLLQLFSADDADAIFGMRMRCTHSCPTRYSAIALARGSATRASRRSRTRQSGDAWSRWRGPS